jgi:hypothetical protein
MGFTQDREQENTFINRVRKRVSLWGKGGYVAITRTIHRLLDYWKNPQREKKLFFCQIEALETAGELVELVLEARGDRTRLALGSAGQIERCREVVQTLIDGYALDNSINQVITLAKELEEPARIMAQELDIM